MRSATEDDAIFFVGRDDALSLIQDRFDIVTRSLDLELRGHEYDLSFDNAIDLIDIVFHTGSAIRATEILKLI